MTSVLSWWVQDVDSACRKESFLLESGTKLGNGADTGRSGLTLKVALIKGVLLRIKVEKDWKDKPHRLHWSVHKLKKEISVNGKSGVES